MTREPRLDLIQEVFAKVLSATESLREQGIGAELAYLLGAIAMGYSYEFVHDKDNRDAEQRDFHDLLVKVFPAEHPVWKSIEYLED